MTDSPSLRIAAINCPACSAPATVVRERTKVTWGGGRPGEVGIEVEIDDERTRCNSCGDEYYSGAQSRRHFSRTMKAVIEVLRADKARLDCLEAAALSEPLLLHDGRGDTRGFRGLGLRPGYVVRSLREAIDTFRGVPQ